MTYDSKKQIYIIRHGQTDFNVRQVVQGRGINSDLNETGIKQAQLFFQKYQDIMFDVVYTSSLKRTQQTVKHFLDNKTPHLIRQEIDEIDWGVFEGVEHHPDLQDRYYGIIDGWKNGDLDVKIEGGESANDLKERVFPFVEEMQKSESQHILVCTHGRTLRLMMCLILGKSISEMDTFKHDNTCLYQVEYNNEQFSLLKENDLSHLGQN